MSGGVSELPDAWVRIQRKNDEFIGFESTDGTSWTEVGRVTLELPETLFAGIAATGRDRLPVEAFGPLVAKVCNLNLAVSSDPTFRRGDSNDDGAVDISDAISTLGVLFLGDGESTCMDASDSNDDGAVDISDVINSLAVLFVGQGRIPTPGMLYCGVDPTDDDVGCRQYGGCP